MVRPIRGIRPSRAASQVVFETADPDEVEARVLDAWKFDRKVRRERSGQRSRTRQRLGHAISRRYPFLKGLLARVDIPRGGVVRERSARTAWSAVGLDLAK